MDDDLSQLKFEEIPMALKKILLNFYGCLINYLLTDYERKIS